MAAKTFNNSTQRTPRSLIAVVEQESILLIGIGLWRFSREEFLGQAPGREMEPTSADKGGLRR
jgi:hypothetical protein